MSSPDRLDLLLRTALHRADDLPVETAYDAVVARSAQRTLRRRIGLAAVVAVLVVAGVGGVLGLQAPPAPPPAVDHPHATLQGAWTRTVTGGEVGDGAWTLTFADPPMLEIVGPPDRPSTSVTDGASYTVSGDEVRVNIFVNGVCDVAQVGTYRWTATGGLLYLDVIADDCEQRQELLVGTWVHGS